jgi:PilZ domain-containing protein
MEEFLDSERRKSRRLPMTFPSHIDLGAEKRACVVSDVSETGARIALDRAVELPEEFTLYLSSEVPRRCRIVWRNDDTVGIVWNWNDRSVARIWRAIFRES